MTRPSLHRRIGGPAIGATVLLALLVMISGSVRAQADPAARDAMIRSAMSAAPDEISRAATVSDWEGNVLREGTNGWTCLPDMADRPGNSPMCVDAVWRAMLDAWQHRKPFRTERVGFGYMLQGDFPGSNTDPYAERETADNQWIADSGPHVMILLPDPASLADLPRTPHEKGPWVMWDGTPYVHIMLPVPRRP